MKKFALLIVLSIFSKNLVIAEEGMLIPSLITAFVDDMQAMGMKLSADDIYNVNESSLKDAILHFGGGCTAELVSGKGLLLTNHHCGYYSIQSHSSLERDYLKNGFWAKSLDEELPNSGLTASRMVRIEDVTSNVLFGTADLDDKQKAVKLQENIAKLIEDATRNTHYEAQIKPFNYGNDYYLIVKEVFKDVRLVGTPPNSIGKFGGDTDNWVWPRHTGDFSVFRVYADANNKPAEYATTNKPYEPLHFLPVSLKDRKVGDFTMIYGFPGKTEQHLSSAHIEYIMNKERPARIAMRDQALNVIDAAMKSSDLIRIQYSSKQASIANAWKKWIGQVDGLRALDAVRVKQDYEKMFNEKVATQKDWKLKYGNLISDMNHLIEKYKNVDFAYAMAEEYLFSSGPEMFELARAMEDLFEKLEKANSETEREEIIEKQKKNAEAFFKDYNSEVDKKIFILLTKEYMKQLGDTNIPSVMKSESVESLAEEIYTKSVLTDKERFLSFLNKLNTKTIKKYSTKDKGASFWNETYKYFVDKVVPDVRVFKREMETLLKYYVEAKKTMFPDAKHWPDANSTLRITYGKIEGSAPHDGMMYTEHTTLNGIIAKNLTGNPDFELLPRMMELAENKEYGTYAQDGELWVCFTGSNHTTGGNSGSPVLDGEGNLIGLNFDRTWESTMSDYMFDPSRCRNITVDIRYVLWVIDVYSGAGYLIEEIQKIK